MSKRKKIVVFIIILLIVSFFVYILTGMLTFGVFSNYKYEDFKYQKFDDGLYIKGLTETGGQKKILVIPETIKGTRVAALEKQSIYMWSGGAVWQSEQLEKVFFTTNMLNVYKETFKGCINLKKILVINFDLENNNGKVTTAARNSGNFVYLAHPIFLECTYNNRDMFFKQANVSYYYNYETDYNYGIHWIDDVEYGSVIEYIPEAPKRDGYVFGGWYREKECVTAWDFIADKLPRERRDEEGNTVYQETMLYAKWIKK